MERRERLMPQESVNRLRRLTAIAVTRKMRPGIARRIVAESIAGEELKQ